jgi:hypothetical protein
VAENRKTTFTGTEKGSEVSEETLKTGSERMIDILKSHGIEMVVGGCGCCASPWVTFKYKGETIVEDDCNAGFDTEEHGKEEK